MNTNRTRIARTAPWSALVSAVIFSLALIALVASLASCSSEAEDNFEHAAKFCHVSTDGTQFSDTEYGSYDFDAPIFCMAAQLMSEATREQWLSTTAMSGTQTVTENGLTFTFSYNGLSETSFLSIRVNG